jgi:hypothetical protein
MPRQIFVSHTKLDADFLDVLDRAEARLGKIHLYRSEYEKIESPPWLTISNELQKSRALFLLIGKEFVKQQASANTSPEARDNWKHTQNWIAYEVGIASAKDIDIWVLCDDVETNFPVPHLNNYVLRRDFDFYKKILNHYSKYFFRKYRPFRFKPTKGSLIQLRKIAINCPHKKCRVSFNLHSSLNKGDSFKCPFCLQPIYLNEDWKPYS